MAALQQLEHESLNEAYFLAISLILAFGILQTSGTALNTDQPVVSVLSCSMYPEINVGDVLVVHGEEYEKIEEGDIAVYSVKKAEISVNGRQHTVEWHEEPVETDIGAVGIRQVIPDRKGNVVNATLTIDGQTINVGEGSTHRLGSSTLSVGEVSGSEIPIVHRVTEKNQDYLQTKGDNNRRQLEFEKRVEPEQIHGTSVLNVPRIGAFKLIVMDLIGFGDGDQPLALDSFETCRKRN